MSRCSRRSRSPRWCSAGRAAVRTATATRAAAAPLPPPAAVCPVGTYGKGGGICAQCSPGTFGNATVGGAVTPAEACSACARGYAPAYGASACVPRVIGTFCEDGWVLHSDGSLEAACSRQRCPLPIPCPRVHLQPVAGRAVAGVVPQVPGGHRATPSAARRSTDAHACEPGHLRRRPRRANCTSALRASTYQPSPGVPPARRARPACSRTPRRAAVRAVPDRQLLAAGAGRRPDVRRVPRRAVLGFDRRDECKCGPVGTVAIGRRATSVEDSLDLIAPTARSLADRRRLRAVGVPHRGASSTTRARRYRRPTARRRRLGGGAAAQRAALARVAALVCL